MLNIYNKTTGRFTGLRYPEETETIKEFHANNGEGFVVGKLDILEKVEDGKPIYRELSQSEKTKALKDEFKFVYTKIINDKLKELDYDSLERVKLWTDDDIFGEESSKIILWYKDIIKKNYQIINDIASGKRGIPTIEEYKAELPTLG